MFRRVLQKTATGCLWYWAGLAIVGLGCGKTAFDGRSYQADDVAFHIGPIPGTWQRLEVEAARLAYRDPATDTILSVNARCGRDADDVPLAALTQHLFIQFTEREIVDQRRLDLDGREALRTELKAKLDGVPRRFRVVVLKKNGCVYDLSEIATVRATAQSAAVFDAVVAGFGTKDR
jgi:hypothetical protein